MSRKSARNAFRSSAVKGSGQAATGSTTNHKSRRWLIGGGILALISLISVGVLAKRGVIGGKSAELSVTKQNAPLNPLPTPVPTPQLSKEYIYAGSRMLAVEDANAPHSTNQLSDLVVWRKDNGAWYIRDSSSGTLETGYFGQNGDKPVPADFDGDGLYDFCVFRPDTVAHLGNWYVQPSSAAFYGVQFGLDTDEAVPADYDGDGRADIAVWRNSAATFYILKSSTGTLQTTAVGQTGDKPIPADYDGDGRADAAVYRLGSTINWIIKQTSLNNAERTESYGGTGDEPVRGDFDGDGKFDPAVRRNQPGNQWLYQSSQSGTSQVFTFSSTVQMLATDKSVTGDYDGDGKTDAAVYRDGATGTDPSYWYIRKSSDGSLRTDQWGQHQDIPVPAPFRR